MNSETHYQDEIDWRDVFRHPVKLFGFSYLYFLAVLVGIGLLYLRHINDTGRNAVTPQVLADSSAFVADIPLQAPRVLPPIDVLRVGVTSDSLVERGRLLFASSCSQCHGDNGEGNGPTAPLLNPPPRNFHSLEGWKNGSKVSQIYTTLQEGIPGSGMASFRYLPPADLFAVTHFVRTFAPHQPVDSPDELLALDRKYSLSKGISVPGQIPVAVALAKVERETAPAAERVHELLAAASKAEGKGAALFRQLASNPSKAAVTGMHASEAGLSAEKLAVLISADPIRAGFRTSVNQLTQPEWMQMTQFLLAMVQGKG